MTISDTLKSVRIVTSDELEVNGGRFKLRQGPALKVRGYTTTNIGSRMVKGGDAQPVYVLSDTDIESGGGRWKVNAGQAIPVTDVIGDTRGVIQGAAIPVFPVDNAGNYDPTFAGYSGKVIATGPIAYWILGEASGLTAVDQINSPAQDGVYSSDVSTWPVGTGIGDGNTAPIFDGAGDRVNVLTAALIAAFNGSEGSFAAWCQVANAGVWADGTNNFIGFLQADAANRIRAFKTSNVNELREDYTAGGVAESITPAASMVTWFHLAITWSLSAGVNGEVRYYLNGVEQLPFDTALGVWVGNLAIAMIGASSAFGANPWEGPLAHPAIWDRPLTGAEVASLATV